MIAWRAAQTVTKGVLSIWLAATITFFGLRILPGSIIANEMMQSGASTSSVRDRVRQLGLDAPPVQQYQSFLEALLRGDLGHSLLDGQSVGELINQRITYTLPLALVASILALILGLITGVTSALGHQSVAGRLSGGFVIIFLSVPAVWTGTIASMAITLLADHGVRLIDEVYLFWVPVILLAAHSAAPMAQAVKSSVRSIMALPHVQTARAKGLAENRVLIDHVLREALLPVIHLFPLQVGFLLGGTVMIESVFSRPGIGLLMVERVLRQDFPVVQGLVILVACVYFILGAIADLIQLFVDPRLRNVV